MKSYIVRHISNQLGLKLYVLTLVLFGKELFGISFLKLEPNFEIYILSGIFTISGWNFKSMSVEKLHIILGSFGCIF